jgi:hypothetical protein
MPSAFQLTIAVLFRALNLCAVGRKHQGDQACTGHGSGGDDRSSSISCAERHILGSDWATGLTAESKLHDPNY